MSTGVLSAEAQARNTKIQGIVAGGLTDEVRAVGGNV